MRCWFGSRTCISSRSASSCSRVTSRGSCARARARARVVRSAGEAGCPAALRLPHRARGGRCGVVRARWRRLVGRRLVALPLVGGRDSCRAGPRSAKGLPRDWMIRSLRLPRRPARNQTLEISMSRLLGVEVTKGDSTGWSGNFRRGGRLGTELLAHLSGRGLEITAVSVCVCVCVMRLWL